MIQRRFLPLPGAIPANNATIVLFCTHPRQPGGSGVPIQPTAPARDPVTGLWTAGGRGIGLANTAEAKQVVAVSAIFLLHNKISAANGLRVYAMDDLGAWQETDLKDDDDVPTIGATSPVVIPALAAGQEHRSTLIVSHLNGVAVEYTAGPDNPESWAGWICVDLDNEVVVR